MLEAAVLERFVRRSGGAGLAPALIRRRLGGLYCAAARQYFKARCYRQARQAHRYARTFTSTAIAALSLPLGRTDERKLPDLQDPV